LNRAERILVTGAAGFIGSSPTDRLLREGRRVLGFDCFDPFYAEAHKRRNLRAAQVSDGSELVEADIRGAEGLARVFAAGRFDAVVHLAALAGVRPSLEQPARYADVNVHGTAALLEAAARHGRPRVVFASSSSVCGESSDGPFRETDAVERPITPYAVTKRAAELVAHTFHCAHGRSITCARISAARDALGYAPAVAFEDGVRCFAAWLREEA
jgi:UDP-glucuronate 4-epimerase